MRVRIVSPYPQLKGPHIEWMVCESVSPTQGATPSLFCDTGGGGGVKSWRRQALFQGRHCFCPTPTLGGGGSSQGGKHPLTALSLFTLNLFPHKISAWRSLLTLAV